MPSTAVASFARVSRPAAARPNDGGGRRFARPYAVRLGTRSSLLGPSATSCRSAKSDADAQGVEAGLFLDEEAMVNALDFPISPEDLIAKAKVFLVAGVEDKGAGMGELMADGFRFVAPVVGPLSKGEFLKALAGFDILQGLPDLKGQNHHFRVDPFEPGRVWFTSRMHGTHTGSIGGAIKPTGITVEVLAAGGSRSDGQEKEAAFRQATEPSYIDPIPPRWPFPPVVDCPPQTCSLTFDTNGLVTKYTVGYVMDREIGNTGGLGGIFGILNAVGSPLPFPEAQPWRKSKRYAFFQWISRITSG